MVADNQIWQVRAAESGGAGRSVVWSRLATGIASEEVGDLDEVRGPTDDQWVTVGEHPIAAEVLPGSRRGVVLPIEDAESDMTPMIDVTFQLLIFFMIAASYVVQKTLDLPSQKEASQGAATVTIEELKAENVMVRISSNGAVSVQEKAVPLDEVETAIGTAVASMKSAELVLDVDDGALHDVVVKVIDAAGAANIEKVLFVSRAAPTAASP